MKRDFNKKRIGNSRGFTLAELLVVIAIIAVLVAVAIPVISAQVEKAAETTDLANIRSAYAEVMTYYLTEDNVNASITVDLVQKEDGWLNGSPAPGVLNGLGDVNGTPAAGGSCIVCWPENADKILFDFVGGGNSTGSGVDREAGQYIEDENDVKSVVTGIAAFIYDIMKDSNSGNIRYEGSRNLADGNDWLAVDYRVLHPSTFASKLVEWNNSRGSYSDYLAGTDITEDIMLNKSGIPNQTDIYLDLETNLPIAVGYYKDGTKNSDYMITYLDADGNPAETRDIGYPDYRQCFAYQKEYVLENFEEDTKPETKLGNV